MFESLSDRIDGAIKTLKGQGRITEINIAGTVKEIRRALVDADVNYKIAKALLERPEKPRPNPTYKNFRILQKELLKKLAMTMNSTTPQEVITQAVKKRKKLKSKDSY